MGGVALLLTTTVLLVHAERSHGWPKAYLLPCAGALLESLVRCLRTFGVRTHFSKVLQYCVVLSKLYPCFLSICFNGDGVIDFALLWLQCTKFEVRTVTLSRFLKKTHVKGLGGHSGTYDPSS